jgi:uncharacterized protein YfaT (DUF1175 family)
MAGSNLKKASQRGGLIPRQDLLVAKCDEHMRALLFAFPMLAFAVCGAAIGSARLDTEADRIAFRSWFAFLAEAQYFTPPPSRAPEIVDCSSLVRYAYREALRRHDSDWAAHANLILIPALPSVQKYNYPETPTGPRLFSVFPERYAEFADARTLFRLNSFLISRSITQAQRGDLLFFRQPSGPSPYHTMIVLDASQITRNRDRYVVYDTGPDGASVGGEMKRLTYSELLHFPQPRWRPVPENSSFLGVFRWNILRD